MKKLSLLMMLMAILTTGSYAQDEEPCGPKWGSDSLACRENMSIFGVRMQNKQYKEAAVQWRKIIEICPYHDEGVVYTNGYKIYKELLEDAEGDEVREAEIKDTIFMIYEMRMGCYGRKKSILFRYGLDMLRWDAINKYNKVVDVVDEYFQKEDPGKIQPVMFKVYFQAVDIQLVKKDIRNPEFVNEFFKVMDLIDRELEHGGDSTKLSDMKEFVLKKVYGRIDDCDEAVAVIDSTRSSWPEESEARADVLNRWIKFLRLRQCTETETYRELASESFDLNPSCESSKAMVKLYLDAGDDAKAFEYAKQAIELCKGTEAEGEAYLIAAKIALKIGSASQAISYGKSAAANGLSEGYVIVAQGITRYSGTCGNSVISRKSVYWLASDYYEKGTGVADKYQGNYPTQQELFGEGFNEGEPYSVPCLGESTVIRKQ